MNRVRRFSNENPMKSKFLKKRLKFPTKIMIWGCISYTIVGRIDLYSGSMNGESYIKTLADKMLPFHYDLSINEAEL